MKVGIMQPYFFPYLGYWQLIKAVDKYVIYDDVNYIKGGWINRNNILVNGEESLINLRLENASPNKIINEIRVLDDDKHKRKLMKSLESNYKKAPFFSEVYILLESIIFQKEVLLSRYLETQIRKICDYLKIDTQIILSSNIDKNNNLKGEEKVVDICEVLEADVYVNAIGGQNLYSKSTFEKHGIELKFLETHILEYEQYKGEFIPNLSIIDLLMFNSKEQMQNLLSEYELL